MIEEFKLYDVIEMKKEHPCNKRTRYFQITRISNERNEIDIRCLGCGNYITLKLDQFPGKCKKISSIKIKSQFLYKK